MTNPETAHPNFDDRAMDYAAELLAKALGLGEGESPFPWQVRLLRRLLRGELPRALDIPTGLGKTSTMAIWLVARALRAAVPTRLVYIVDRKVVVDQATRVAEDLREWVEANRRKVVEATGGRVGYVHIPDMGPRGFVRVPACPR